MSLLYQHQRDTEFLRFIEQSAVSSAHTVYLTSWVYGRPLVLVGYNTAPLYYNV